MGRSSLPYGANVGRTDALTRSPRRSSEATFLECPLESLETDRLLRQQERYSTLCFALDLRVRLELFGPLLIHFRPSKKSHQLMLPTLP